MITTNINRVKIEGDNVFVFQLINADGNKVEEKKTFEEFVNLIVKPYTEKILLLEKSLNDKIKIEGLLTKEVDKLDSELIQLRNEKKNLEDQISVLLENLKRLDREKLSEFYKEITVNLLNGKIDESLVIFEKSKLEERERRLRLENRDMAYIRMIQADIYRMKFKFEEAIKCYDIAISFFQDWRMCFEIGKFYWFLKKNVEAENYCQKALEFCENDIQKAKVYNIMGLIEGEKQNNSRAIELYETSLKYYGNIEKLSQNSDISGYSITLNNLGIIYQNIKEYKKSIDTHLKNLAIRNKILENEQSQDAYIDYNITLHNLSTAQLHSHDYKEAKKNCKASISFFSSIVGEDYNEFYDNLAMGYDNLGSIIRSSNGNEEDTIFAYEKSIELYRKSVEYSPSSYLPKLGMVLFNFGMYLMGRRNLNTIEVFTIEAINIYTHLVKNDIESYSATLATMLMKRGVAYIDLNKEELTKTYFDEAITVMDKLLEVQNTEENELELANQAYTIAVCCFEHKKLKYGESYFLVCLSVLNSLVKTEEEKFFLSMGHVKKYLGRIYSAYEDFENAEKLYAIAYNYMQDIALKYRNFEKVRISCIDILFSTIDLLLIYKRDKDLILNHVGLIMQISLTLNDEHLIRNYIQHCIQRMEQLGIDGKNYIDKWITDNVINKD